LIRNHGEAVIDNFGFNLKGNIFGGNFRMNEIEAAIAIEQLKKLDFLTNHRKKLANYLIRELKKFNFLTLPEIDNYENSHVFYFFVMQFNCEKINLSREEFYALCLKCGLELRKDYVKPAYLNSIYLKNKIYPKKNTQYQKNTYKKGLCPIAEDILNNKILFGKFCRYPLTKKHMDEIVSVFTYVYNLQKK